MKTFKLFIKLLIFGPIVLFIAWVILNFIYSDTITNEQVLHLVKKFILEDFLRAMLLLLLSVLLLVFFFYSLDKLFANIYSFIKNYNPLVCKINSFQTQFDNYQYYDLLNHMDEFNPRWLFLKSYKVNYSLLKAETLLAVGDLQKLGKTLFELQPNILKDRQKIYYQKLRLQLFLQSGYIIGAQKLVEEIKSNQLMNDNDISLVIPSSIIKELSGDLRGAREILIGAIKDFDTLQPKNLIPLYNNLGRISGVFRNNSAKLNYYEKSKTLIEQHKIKNHIHIVYPNLIDTFLTTLQFDKADILLQEYSKLIDRDNFYDKLNYYNYLIEFHRQKNDQQALRIAVEQGENELRRNLSDNQKFIFDASTLRIKFNGGLNYIEILTEISKNWSYFCDLDFLTKLAAFKEIYLVFAKNNILQSDASFTPMYKDLIGFLRDDAPKLIDLYIKNDIKPYEVYLHKNLLNDKIEFTRLTQIQLSTIFFTINSVIKLMKEIADLLESNGNLLEGYIQYLNILDESIHSLKNPLSENEKKSIVDNAKKLFHNVHSRVYIFENHPILPEFFVRLAWYALQLGERSISYRFYSEFHDLNISINHFSKYFQEYYNDLKNEFS